MGDPDRLQQVISNLIVNAVKFTPRGGNVEVRVEPGNPTEISVKDTGVGISPEFLPHVFDRFRQAKNADGSMNMQGLGLGLAIVKNLVELHGGQVRVESGGLGLGSKFTVALPKGLLLSASTPPNWFEEDAGQNSMRTASQLEGLNILFVDDHAEARELFKQHRSIITEARTKTTGGSRPTKCAHALRRLVSGRAPSCLGRVVGGGAPHFEVLHRGKHLGEGHRLA